MTAKHQKTNKQNEMSFNSEELNQDLSFLDQDAPANDDVTPPGDISQEIQNEEELATTDEDEQQSEQMEEDEQTEQNTNGESSVDVFMDQLCDEIDSFEDPQNVSLIMMSLKMEVKELKMEVAERERREERFLEDRRRKKWEIQKLLCENVQIKKFLEMMQENQIHLSRDYTNAVKTCKKLNAARKELSQKIKEIDQNSSEMTKNHAEYDKVMDQLEIIKQNHAELGEKYENLEMEHNGVLEEMEDIRKKHENLQNEMKLMEERAISAEKTVEKKEQLVSTLQDKEEQVKQYVAKLRDEITELNRINREQQEDFQVQLATKANDFEKNREHYENQINKMYKEMERVQNVTKEVAGQQKNNQYLIKSLNDQIKELENEKKSYIDVNTDLLIRLRDTKKDPGSEVIAIKAEHKQQIDALTVEIRELKDKVFEFTHRDLEQKKKITELEVDKTVMQHSMRNDNVQEQNNFSTPMSSLNIPPVSPSISPIPTNSQSRKMIYDPKNRQQETTEKSPRQFFAQTTPIGATRNSTAKKRPQMEVLPTTAQPNMNRSDTDVFRLNPHDMSAINAGFDSDDDSSVVEVTVTTHKKPRLS